MKTKRSIRYWLPVGAGLMIVIFQFPANAQKEGYVAHEWGTFTSVQGGDGQLLDWRPLQSSGLPHFVYNWQHAGLGRQATGTLVEGKGALMALQRMETPVIYFYADQAETVDVSVKFPKGVITEWYPQTARTGPSLLKTPRLVAGLDDAAHRVGAKPEFTFVSLFEHSATRESSASWFNVQILPPKDSEAATPTLLLDRSGSHYFAARRTDANCLQVDSLVATNPVPEREKFLFYRGVGNFSTPLHVQMSAEGAIRVENQGKQSLDHLFVLGMENGRGEFIHLDQLAPGETRQVRLADAAHQAQLPEVSAKLGEEMAKSLAAEGLFPREASAMVQTWRDSWFEADGVRVLYVLPRSWTDETLPISLKPAPRQLVRVMVGRAEVLTPALENRLAEALHKTELGEPGARDQVVADLRNLGRFADPALRLAMEGSGQDLRNLGWNLFQVASQH